MEGAAGEQGPSEEHPHARRIFQHVQTLIRLNRQHEALQYGASITLYSDPRLFVFIREFRTSLVILAVYNGTVDMTAPVSVQIDQNPHLPQRTCSLLEGRTLRDALSNGERTVVVQEGAFLLQLPAKTAVIFEMNPR